MVAGVDGGADTFTGGASVGLSDALRDIDGANSYRGGDALSPLSTGVKSDKLGINGPQSDIGGLQGTIAGSEEGA